jgi:uncharacterized protein
MQLSEVVRPLLGGVLIGTSATILLVFNGRIAGISGIVGGLVAPASPDRPWRGSFVAGLMVGAVLLALLYPASLRVELAPKLPLAIVAGLLVGFGTQLGNGCTSGHGVCGISRLSPRSIVATVVFIATGAIALAVMKKLGGFT